MPSEKLKQTLLSRTDFTNEEVEKISENEGWQIVYALDAEEKKPEDKRPEICFTGFGKSEKEELRNIAENHNYKIKDGVTKDLKILVYGDNAGPGKIKKAELQGCKIFNKQEFIEILKN